MNTVKSEFGVLPLLNPKMLKTSVFTVALFIISILISQFNFLLFHCIVELFGFIIAFTIAVIAYNTYHLSQKLRLTFFGISFSFVSIFSMLHMLTYSGMRIFYQDTSNLSMYFSIISKYIESLSLLVIPLMFLDKRMSKIRPKTAIYFYFLLSILLFSITLLLDKSGIKMLYGLSPTFLKFIHEAAIMIILIAVIIIMSLNIKMRNQEIYKYPPIFLLVKIVSQLFFIFNQNVSDIYSVIAHTLRLLCFYCIYKALVETSLRMPVQLLFKSLNEASSELQEKTIQLQQTNYKLVLENVERKQTEIKLSQSKERYKQLIELFPEGFFLHCNGTITFANASALKLVGASHYNEVIGKCALNFLIPECHSTVEERMKRLLETRDVSPLAEEKLKRIDGTIVDIEVISAPVIDNDKALVLSIVRDITERKKAEELKRSIFEKNLLLDKTIEMDKIKTEFFSNISHELRTPLNVILSTLQLSTKYLDENTIVDGGNKISKYFGIMNQNCLRLLRLVNNLIDVTKIDAGYLEPNMRNCNIISTIEEITLSVAQYIESKGISLIFDTEVEEKILACDSEKVERIMLNLLSNATKFTKPGGSIYVNISDKASSIIISIKDTGIGIPKDKQSEIFDRFKQVDQSLTRNHEGSGIGLSLVKSLVEMHKGTISLESEPGMGSIFYIEIPVSVINDTTTKPEEELFDSSQSRIEKIKIEFSDIYQ